MSNANSEPDHYVYIYAQYTYGPEVNSKVGVSKNPEKRKFYSAGPYRNHGGYFFYKKWLCPSRAAAFALETYVKAHFRPQAIYRELFRVPPAKVERFIEEFIGNTSA